MNSSFASTYSEMNNLLESAYSTLLFLGAVPGMIMCVCEICLIILTVTRLFTQEEASAGKVLDKLYLFMDKGYNMGENLLPYGALCYFVSWLVIILATVLNPVY